MKNIYVGNTPLIDANGSNFNISNYLINAIDLDSLIVDKTYEQVDAKLKEALNGKYLYIRGIIGGVVYDQYIPFVFTKESNFLKHFGFLPVLEIEQGRYDGTDDTADYHLNLLIPASLSSTIYGAVGHTSLYSVIKNRHNGIKYDDNNFKIFIGDLPDNFI